MGAIEKEPASPFGWELINDVSALPDDQNTIIDYLLRRVERGQIYTWVGALLLALNPGNVVLSEEYNSTSTNFANINEVARKDIIPDINATASRAHHRLIQGLGKPCQVIIISGDSGTGKTFNANKALNFLAALNDVPSAPSMQSSKIQDIVRKISSACPLIAAFSTATTEKNLKSSRHGQLVKLQYNNGFVSGATIRSFLLERSRVTMGYDNFHIFYQFIAGLSEKELNNFNLSKHRHYDLISFDVKNAKNDYSSNFEDTIEAMSDLGFSLQERNNIFQVISVLLHLGNIKFKQNYLGGCTVNTDDEVSEQALYHVCTVTSLCRSKLIQLLTTSIINRNVNDKKQTDYCDLRTTEMCYNRLHSIIRHTYDKLFQQLINRINQSMSSNFESQSWLGILDIFGFEIFAENRIEQLCINYANEKLQLYFMQDYLDSARHDMMEEGFLDFIETEQTQLHKDRLAVIESHLFPALIDATQCSAQFNESALRQRLLDNFTTKFLAIPQNSQTFIIQHFSNPVEYSFENFVSKNIDKVPPELSMIFQNSSNEYLSSLKDSVENKSNQTNGKIYAKKCTTLSKVRQSLDMLVKELNRCDSHYVRCVKPCLANGLWKKDDFAKQLKCIGIFDALSLAKCKFPIRTSYAEFLQRYKFKTTGTCDTSSSCQIIAQEILGSEVAATSIHFGSKLIFFTETVFFQLERFRKKFRAVSARKIQVFWKKRRRNKIDCDRNRISNAKHNLVVKSKSMESVDYIIPNVQRKASSLNVGYYKLKTPPRKLRRTISREVYWNNKINLSSDQKSRKSEKSKFKCKIDQSDGNAMKTIFYEGCVFYYKNRILSRQKLSVVPVRFHTKRTCLKGSHRLPLSSMPRGLVDCL